ncbi:hypothetical protein ACVRZR_06935 [Streptococcus entericus]|uniref:hypothetical protein n=1 Tax=Streptococcus entericus TaxID=155680 RepID=UPI00036B0AD2|nr:hypothetical protein [Streptococcus entericus]
MTKKDWRTLLTKVLPLALSRAVIKYFSWSGFAVFVLTYMTPLADCQQDEALIVKYFLGQ